MLSGSREDRAAFAGCDLLVGVETEDGQIAEGAHGAAVECGADGLACIFEDH